MKNMNEPVPLEDQEKPPNLAGSQMNPSFEPYAPPLMLPDSSLRPANTSGPGADTEGNRLSFSSLYSLGSVIYNGATGGSSVPSVASSNTGSVKSNHLDPTNIPSLPNSSPLGSAKAEASQATTATNPILVIANAQSPNAGPCSKLFAKSQT